MFRSQVKWPYIANKDMEEELTIEQVISAAILRKFQSLKMENQKLQAKEKVL